MSDGASSNNSSGATTAEISALKAEAAKLQLQQVEYERESAQLREQLKESQEKARQAAEYERESAQLRDQLKESQAKVRQTVEQTGANGAVAEVSRISTANNRNLLANSVFFHDFAQPKRSRPYTSKK